MPKNSAPRQKPNPVLDLQNVPPKPDDSDLAQAGVHVVVAESLAIMPFLLIELAHRLAGGKKVAGVKFPAMSAVLLTSGHEYEFEQMRALATAFDLARTENDRTLEQIARQPLDLLHHETVELLRPHLQDQRHAIVPLGSCDRLTGEQAANIGLLHSAAAQANSHLILVLPMIRPKHHPHLTAICSPVIRATQVEPDPGFMLAWSLSRDDVRLPQMFGGGRRMTQIKSEEKRFTVNERPFISIDLTRRVMALCRSAGLSVTETAVVVELNKSTVSRADSGLPKPPANATTKGWWSRYQEAYHFDESVITKMTARLEQK